MKKYLIGVLLITLLFTDAPVSACTGFVASHGDKVLAGNNEDYTNPCTKVWFEPPIIDLAAKRKRYGRVYFGFDNFWPQGGMNDQGLFFDCFATPSLEVILSKHKRKYNGNLMDKVMAECATVEQALGKIAEFNLEHMRRYQTFIADKTGDAAIIEGDVIIRKKGKYQVVTNFYQSKYKRKKYPCERYNIAAGMLENCENISIESFRRILAATHQEGDHNGTLYSNVYDLKAGLVYLYHFHNFEDEVVIDLEKELKKGRHAYDLPSLFPKSYAAESMLKVYLERKDTKAENIDPKMFDSYIGIYKMPENIAPHTLIAITRRGKKLYGFYPDDPSNELMRQSENHFLNITKNGRIKVSFQKNETGKVTGISVESEGINFTAEKIR